jgi:hypothetical protein
MNQCILDSSQEVLPRFELCRCPLAEQGIHGDLSSSELTLRSHVLWDITTYMLATAQESTHVATKNPSIDLAGGRTERPVKSVSQV